MTVARRDLLIRIYCGGYKVFPSTFPSETELYLLRNGFIEAVPTEIASGKVMYHMTITDKGKEFIEEVPRIERVHRLLEMDPWYSLSVRAPEYWTVREQERWTVTAIRQLEVAELPDFLTSSREWVRKEAVARLLKYT